MRVDRSDNGRQSGEQRNGREGQEKKRDVDTLRTDVGEPSEDWIERLLAGSSQVCKGYSTQLLTKTGLNDLIIVTEGVEAEWLSNEC